MLTRLINFYQNLNQKTLLLIFPLFFLLLAIVALRLLGFWQPIEWAAYDLLFALSPAESRDERVVLVVWSEQDLQSFEESIISDRALSFVLEKIREQQPRVMGLDLYRDIPVPSRHLSGEQNDAAYQRLQAIFRSTPNLIGIEKVREPIINPPRVLAEEQRVASSDLVKDPDNVVRRALIDSHTQLNPNDPQSVKLSPYIGTALAGEYLYQKGWQHEYDSLTGSLRFFKDQQQIVIKPLKTVDGAYQNNEYALSYPINWRRGENSFAQVSVGELMANSVASDFFQDKIVIVGNAASSTADRHHIPLDRWSQNYPQWTYGVEIPAQVTSSIVSAALDSRPLISVVPWGMGYWLLFVSSLIVAVTTLKLSELNLLRYLLLSGLCSLSLTILLGLLGYGTFQAGWWLPIVPSLLGVWGTFLATHLSLFIFKEYQNLVIISLISSNLNHKMGNKTSSISNSTKRLKQLIQLDYDLAFQDFQQNQKDKFIAPDLSFSDSEAGQKFNHYQAQIQTILHEIQVITEYRKRTNDFIKLATKPQSQSRMLKINPLVQRIVERITQEKRTESQGILIQENYAPALKQTKIDWLIIEIVVENLLDNAIYAVTTKCQQQAENYLPTISIQTHKKSNLFGNFLEITIQDNGIGIAQQQQTKIFERFVSYRSQKGQGVGLTLVKEALKFKQGSIKVSSKLGTGSKFTVLLPLQKNIRALAQSWRKSTLSTPQR